MNINAHYCKPKLGLTNMWAPLRFCEKSRQSASYPATATRAYTHAYTHTPHMHMSIGVETIKHIQRSEAKIFLQNMKTYQTMAL